MPPQYKVECFSRIEVAVVVVDFLVREEVI
jgi:hypothetical protein